MDQASHQSEQSSQKRLDASPEAQSTEVGFSSLNIGSMLGGTSPPLDPKKILQLQRVIGNQRTIQFLNAHRENLKSQQADLSDTSTSSEAQESNSIESHVYTSTFAIQRRVPEADNIDDEAVLTESAEESTINTDGLRVALRRVVQDMDEDTRAEFLASRVSGVTPVQDVIESGTGTQLLALIRNMENDPQWHSFVMENTTDEFVPLRERGDVARVRSVIRELSRRLRIIGTSTTHDEHLQNVFGEDPTHGWRQAKQRFAQTATGLLRALRRNHIGGDWTGAATEMDAGGVTAFNARLMVDAQFIENPELQNAKLAYVHEGFHYTFEDIRDIGGYRYTGSFRTCSPSRKFNNAAHYEEVYARTMGWGDTAPELRVYEPSSDFGGSGAARTPTHRAYDSAVGRLRVAWNEGLSLHSQIRDFYNLQQAGQTLTEEESHIVNHHSHIFALTYHRRIPTTTTPINQIDLVLVEGVVRRISEALSAVQQLGPTLPVVPDNWPATVDSYIQHGLQAVGEITGSPQRDLRLIRYLRDYTRMLSNREELPPEDLR